MLRSPWFAFVLLLASGCASPMTSDVDGGGTIPDGGVCVPGGIKSCGCAGTTSSGKRTCGESGKYGDCVCDGGSTTMPGSGGSNPGMCGTCSGCCDGSKCVELSAESDAKCGVKGKMCSACAGSSTCDTDTGKCVGAGGGGGCAASCDGCCTTKGCVGYQDTDSFACGVNGANCKVCEVQGGLCDDSGMCTNQVAYYDSYWITVPSIDASGNSCNIAAGLEVPDLFVCMSAMDPNTKQVLQDAAGNPMSGCTKSCDGQDICNLSTNDGLVRRASDGQPVEFTGDVLRDGKIVVDVWDFDGDGADHDLLGEGPLPSVTVLDGATRSGGPYSASKNFTCTVTMKYKVAYQF